MIVNDMNALMRELSGAR